MVGFYCIHEDFAESAEDAIAADRPEVAVVLVATAVEHILNEFYREVLAPRLSDEVITEVLRSKLHVKLGWLMTLAVGRSIPSGLGNRIKRLADLRNAFVHHKCVPFKLGNPVGESYYHRLVKQVRDLGLESLHSIPRDLQNELEAILEEVDSDYQLAKETAKMIDALSDE